METEHFFVCPHCWEEVSMLLDLSVDAQEYLEDCEVCCKTIAISFTAREFELTSFSAESAEQLKRSRPMPTGRDSSFKYEKTAHRQNSC